VITAALALTALHAMQCLLGCDRIGACAKLKLLCKILPRPTHLTSRVSVSFRESTRLCRSALHLPAGGGSSIHIIHCQPKLVASVAQCTDLTTSKLFLYGPNKGAHGQGKNMATVVGQTQTHIVMHILYGIFYSIADLG